MRTAVRVKQTSATTGTGNLTLAAAPTGYLSFLSQFTDENGFLANDWISYMVENSDGSEWEYGACQIINDASNGQLARASGIVFASSNAGSLVSFTGSTTVRCVTPPEVFNLDRNCSVSRTTSTQALNASTTATVTWNNEIADTDSMYPGTGDAINIPYWADRFHVTFSGEVSISGATQYPGLRVRGYNCKTADTTGNARAEATMTEDNSTAGLFRGVIHATFEVDRVALVDTNQKATIYCQIINPYAGAGTINVNETYCNVQIIG